MRQGRSFVVGVAVLLGMPGALAALPDTRELTLAERVEQQRRIEEVYWRHRIWPRENQSAKPSLSEMLPADAIRAKIVDSLKKSRALEEIWHRPVGAAVLQAEVDRMARDTRDGARLRELYRALGDDAFLIAEVLARPVLVERLIRDAYAQDERFHGEASRAAASARASCAAPTCMKAMGGAYHETSWKRETSVEAWQAERERLLPPGQLGGVEEEPDAFVVRALLAEDEDEMTTASVVWAKRPFDDWWREQSAILDVAIAPASGPFQVPAVSSSPCVDGTWTPTRLDVPDGRDTHAVVWTGAEMIVWGGFNGWTLDSGGRYDPATDTWRPTARGANTPNARQVPTAVWTGTEVIVWGGNLPGATNTGGRYDPALDRWLPTSTGAGVPAGRHGHAAVWTGTEMIVWGGNGNNSTKFGDGARYDPATDGWTALAATAAPSPRGEHAAVWTGTEMIVWGGNTSSGLSNTGGRYDAVNDTWLPISTVNAPNPRGGHTTVWTGTEMIVWGGSGGGYLATGGRYSPATDSWAATSTGPGTPAARSRHTAVWTGTEMIVWGGTSGPYYNTGARYDPAADSWTPTSTGPGVAAGRGYHTAVWTGSEMIVWGGRGSSLIPLKSGARYDPSADAWVPTTLGASVPVERTRHSAVWTGTELIVWGGRAGSSSSLSLDSGGVYDPALDAWRPTSRGANLPPARAGHTAVWTGTYMIVWGTYSAGGRYNPSTDTWLFTSTVNAPTNRTGHSSVWTGTRMIVWGGVGSVDFGPMQDLSTGGRYDPSTNTWTATSLVGEPAGRRAHTAVWTGAEMIVWGGEHFHDEPGPWEPWYTQSGGRYNPSTNVWMSIPTAGAPQARTEHRAVWTGTEMIVWGGLDVNGTGLATGGRYDPSTNAWTATPVAGAPAGRYTHAAVWTGAEMIVWGGDGAPHPALFFDTAARYDPWSGTWTPAPGGPSVPTKRTEQTAVWTGAEMIVWGGYPYTSSGGLFCVSDCFDPGLPPGTAGALSAARSGETIALSWPSIETATTFDVLRGALGGWPVGSNPADESCFADLSGLSFSDDAQPGPGAGWWYLVRAANGCGKGSWGWQASNGVPTLERISSTCP